MLLRVEPRNDKDHGAANQQFCFILVVKKIVSATVRAPQTAIKGYYTLFNLK